MALFGNPAAKKAAHKQNEIMFNQLALAANLWNKGTAAENTKQRARDLEQKFYSEKVFNAQLKIQGKAFKQTEHMARLLATSGRPDEGGRSKRYNNNLGLKAYSKISQMENMARFVAGEGASANIHTGAIQLATAEGKANALAGVGVGAKAGVTYTTKNQLFEAIKLASQIGTGNWGGAFGTLQSGQSASMFQWMMNRHGTGTDIFNKGGTEWP